MNVSIGVLFLTETTLCKMKNTIQVYVPTSIVKEDKTKKLMLQIITLAFRLLITLVKKEDYKKSKTTTKMFTT